MSSDVGRSDWKKLAWSEQQMSDEWAAGMIAFSTAMAPPTGMDAGALPEGQASGMSVPAMMTGQRRSSVIWLMALVRFFCDWGQSASMASVSGEG